MLADENASPFLFIKKYPFFRILAFFSVGVLFQYYLQISFQKWTVGFSFIICGLSIFYLLPISYKFLFRWIQGLLIGGIIIIFGGIVTYIKDIRHQDSWIGNTDSFQSLVITLNEPLTERAKTFKTTAIIKGIYTDGKFQASTGNVIVYLPKDSVSVKLGYGNVLLVNKRLQHIENPKSSGSFDYKRYCAQQNIYHQIFLRKNDFVVLDKKVQSPFTEFIFTLRDKTLRILESYIYNKNELGVAEALLIGYRNNLDKELLQAYTNTGVVHLIAISGLHVGMIYALLLFLFSLIPNFYTKRFLQPVIILLLLWIFSLLTGAGASVMRSTVMFSFIVLGDYFGKRNNIFNNLAASAFCLLVCNPSFLWDIGFQLSYAAVLGIVLFQKHVRALITLDNKLLQNLWTSAAITLSAQVFTTPITIYYFHQFSNLFLFSNLISIPLSSIVLYGELALLIVSPIKSIANLAGMFTEKMLYLMNSIIYFFNALPCAVTPDLNLSLFETILVCGGICMGYLWLCGKKHDLISRKGAKKIRLRAKL